LFAAILKQLLAHHKYFSSHSYPIIYALLMLLSLLIFLQVAFIKYNIARQAVSVLA